MSSNNPSISYDSFGSPDQQYRSGSSSNNNTNDQDTWITSPTRSAKFTKFTHYSKSKHPSVEIPSHDYFNSDSHTLAIFDGYPKAKFHYLILPRIPFVLEVEERQEKEEEATNVVNHQKHNQKATNRNPTSDFQTLTSLTTTTSTSTTTTATHTATTTTTTTTTTTVSSKTSFRPKEEDEEKDESTTTTTTSSKHNHQITATGNKQNSISNITNEQKKKSIIVPSTDLQNISTLLASPYAKEILQKFRKQSEFVCKKIKKEMLKTKFPYPYSTEECQTEWKIRLGFHAIPTMDTIHLHVISDDLISKQVQHKSHYLKFDPLLGFWLDLDHIEELIKRGFKSLPHTQEQYKLMLSSKLISFRDGKYFSHIFELKQHLEQSWIEEIKRRKVSQKRSLPSNTQDGTENDQNESHTTTTKN